MQRRGACLATNFDGKMPPKNKCEKMVYAGNDWMFPALSRSLGQWLPRAVMNLCPQTEKNIYKAVQPTLLTVCLYANATGP